MPDVRGLTVDQVRARIRRAGFTGAVVLDKHSSCIGRKGYAVGTVCVAYPRPGARASKKYTIRVTLMPKPAPPRQRKKWATIRAPKVRLTKIPEVRGMTVAEATARLRSTGFKGKMTVDEAPNCPSSARYEVGQVCEVYPRVGQSVPKEFTFKFTLQHDRATRNGGDSVPE